MNDFVGYCDAIKAVGAETHTPVIDLQTKALAYYTSVGYDVVEVSPPYDGPGQVTALNGASIAYELLALSAVAAASS